MYSCKRILMDPKPIFVRLLSFIVIILILGTVFENQFNITSLDKVKIAYSNQDSGQYGTMFIDSLIHSDEIKSLTEFTEVSSMEEGQKIVNDGKADALVYITKDFSALKGNEDTSRTVEVYLSKYTGVNTTVIKNVLESLTNYMNTSIVIYSMTGSPPAELSNTGNSLQDEPLSNSVSATAMGYYSIAMLLMLLLRGQEYGTAGMGEDYLGTLGDRMKLSPIKPYEQYAGKIIALSLITFLQGLIIILFTKYAYGVDWGKHLAVILLIVFVFSLLTTTLGAMLTILTKDAVKADSIANIVTLGATFIVGGFVILDFGTLAHISPSYYAKSAIFNVIYNDHLDRAFVNIGEMLAITLLFALISIVVSRRKRA
ncbi:ABC transporter permease [Paenibacillus sp. NPDC057934]|uniref:ABC transporter permease n=1 Tax=Paenibacillus sp. NPDC057934 TaxID=3346282 RepID=UPI0036DE3661